VKVNIRRIAVNSALRIDFTSSEMIGFSSLKEADMIAFDRNPQHTVEPRLRMSELVRGIFSLAQRLFFLIPITRQS
jgi:hypothetical protein